ncbi:hypothetical protein SJAG_05143 [Schizosaccharomyces japonicus yFS275]|uniref:Retrotransposon gag domain-containing protein n=1 Tax=Schizosaccharomyces japonicus (strain yFS275 / FY16936) TaxID=402676 RepID=B6K8G7_SCHJY|nr:hypothetical protein SJAG_05143 [Schizosaccharomyces japonicus yFS275]EEB05010.2 hypothetical protein SJAG_05143 [Schizosaccharomyces japonicus yFS275]
MSSFGLPDSPSSPAAVAADSASLPSVSQIEKLPKYDGRRDSAVLDSWIYTMGNYLKLLRVPSSSVAFVVSLRLDGAALRWFRSRFPEEAHPTLKWDEISAGLVSAFRPINDERLMRNEFVRLRQTGKASEFVDRLRELQIVLPLIRLWFPRLPPRDFRFCSSGPSGSSSRAVSSGPVSNDPMDIDAVRISPPTSPNELNAAAATPASAADKSGITLEIVRKGVVPRLATYQCSTFTSQCLCLGIPRLVMELIPRLLLLLPRLFLPLFQ